MKHNINTSKRYARHNGNYVEYGSFLCCVALYVIRFYCFDIYMFYIKFIYKILHWMAKKHYTYPPEIPPGGFVSRVIWCSGAFERAKSCTPGDDTCTPYSFSLKVEKILWNITIWTVLAILTIFDNLAKILMFFGNIQVCG